MNQSTELYKYESLAFFGEVNASISHELKNVMAIISETAGLLGDLADLATTGNPVSPESLKTHTGSIIEVIQRGFDTIRQMNRFSHSIDNPITEVNLTELIDLVINLTSYLRFAGKTNVHNCDISKPVVKTSPFILQTIIYKALETHYKNGSPGEETVISVCSQDKSIWRIIFSKMNSGKHLFPDNSIKTMAEAINLKIVNSEGRLELDVPIAI